MNEAKDKEIIKRFKTLIDSRVEINALKGIIDEVKNEVTLVKFYKNALKNRRLDVIKCLIPAKLDVTDDWFDMDVVLDYAIDYNILTYILQYLPNGTASEMAYKAIDDLELMKILVDWEEIDVDDVLAECSKNLSLSVIKFLVNECDADIHVCEDLLFWSAVEQEEMDIADYVIEYTTKHNQKITCKDQAQTDKLKEVMNSYLNESEEESESESDSSEYIEREESDSD